MSFLGRLQRMLLRMPVAVQDDCVAHFNATVPPKQFTVVEMAAHTKEYLERGANLAVAANLAVGRYCGATPYTLAITELYDYLLAGIPELQRLEIIGDWSAARVLALLTQQRQAA